MRYLGGKSRLARKFAPVLKDALSGGRSFYEPFVGGFNVVPALDGAAGTTVCNDIHRGLIGMYRAMVDGEFYPPEVMSVEEYQSLRSGGLCDPLSTFASFGCSFGSKEWGGYARDAQGVNYCGGARRSLLAKKKHMDGVVFQCGDYRQYSAEVIYCDPPYEGTTGYRTGSFDHRAFRDWCEARAVAGCRVFVSEFRVPQGVLCEWRTVWSVERRVTVRRDSKYATKTDLLVEVIPL